MGLKENIINEYALWLKLNVKSEASQKRYLSAITIVSNEMNNFGVIDKDLFEVESFDEYKELFEKIIKYPFFITKDEIGHHMYSAALKKHYANFLADKYDCDNYLDVKARTITIKSEIIRSLNEIGREASLIEICEVVLNNNNLNFTGSRNPQKTILNVLRTYSKNDNTNRNVFYNIEKDSQEFWGLQSTLNVIEYNSDESLNLLTRDNKLLDKTLSEGERKKIQSYVYERNGYARKLCIKYYGSICQVCGTNMAKIYGKEFEGKIHVHHKVPLNQIGVEYSVDPIKDLIPVCPNCHMIIHCKKDGFYTVEEVKNMLKN